MTSSLLVVKHALQYIRLLGKNIINHGRLISSANLSNVGDQNGTQFPSFDDMIIFRRGQANRSALVEIKSENCVEEVVRICEHFGTVKSHIYFHPVPNSRKSVCLVELENEEQLKSILNNSKHSTEESNHVFSRLLLCKKKGNQSLSTLQKRNCVEIYEHPDEKSILHDIANISPVTEQMKMLYRKECVSDLGFRIRFLVCTQIEDSLKSLFPHCQVLPFGSTVNSYGRYNCDLDILVDLDHLPGTKEGFTFQTSKMVYSTARDRTQFTLNFLGDMIQNFFPGMAGCKKILHANVPILKVYHSLAGVDCDISMSNNFGFYMSELLYLFGELDGRVRPLVYTLRRWAKSQGLTQDVPGPYITNFSLTLMVLFFLQCQKPPVLPSLEMLQQLASPMDIGETNDESLRFQRNISKIPKSTNQDDLGTLLMNFFLFYEKLSLGDNAISLVSGKICQKPSRKALFIQNPLELDLNVSKNVSLKEITKFKSAVINTLCIAEEHLHKSGIQKLLVQVVKVHHDHKVHLRHFHFDSLFEESQQVPTLPKESVQKNDSSFSQDQTTLEQESEGASPESAIYSTDNNKLQQVSALPEEAVQKNDSSFSQDKNTLKRKSEDASPESAKRSSAIYSTDNNKLLQVSALPEESVHKADRNNTQDEFLNNIIFGNKYKGSPFPGNNGVQNNTSSHLNTQNTVKSPAELIPPKKNVKRKRDIHNVAELLTSLDTNSEKPSSKNLDRKNVNSTKDNNSAYQIISRALNEIDEKNSRSYYEGSKSIKNHQRRPAGSSKSKSIDEVFSEWW